MAWMTANFLLLHKKMFHASSHTILIRYNLNTGCIRRGVVARFPFNSAISMPAYAVFIETIAGQRTAGGR